MPVCVLPNDIKFYNVNLLIFFTYKLYNYVV